MAQNYRHMEAHGSSYADRNIYLAPDLRKNSVVRRLIGIELSADVPDVAWKFLRVPGTISDMPEPDVTRLAAAVREERHRLRLSKDTAAASVGMSAVTWTRVENGFPVRPLSYSGIDQALGWKAGCCVAILDGADPPLPSVSTPPVGYGLDEEARGLAADQIEAVKNVIRGMKPR